MVVWKWTTGNIISKLVIYYDNQLSKARWSLVRKFWTVKIRMFSRTTFLKHGLKKTNGGWVIILVFEIRCVEDHPFSEVKIAKSVELRSGKCTRFNASKYIKKTFWC